MVPSTLLAIMLHELLSMIIHRIPAREIGGAFSPRVEILSVDERVPDQVAEVITLEHDLMRGADSCQCRNLQRERYSTARWAGCYHGVSAQASWGPRAFPLAGRPGTRLWVLQLATAWQIPPCSTYYLSLLCFARSEQSPAFRSLSGLRLGRQDRYGSGDARR